MYDADLKSYFDTIPHDKLIKCLERRIADRSVLGLIRQWLTTAVVETDGKGGPPRRSYPKAGTPQGGVISPLLVPARRDTCTGWMCDSIVRKGRTIGRTPGWYATPMIFSYWQKVSANG